VQRGNAGGDGDVVLVEVLLVASPGERLAVRGEDDAGDVADGACGAMVAGDPLRRSERDGAGFDGDVDLGVVDLARRVREVGRDGDRGLLGNGGRGEQSEGQKSGRANGHGRGFVFLERR